jgi:hypothetical protein
VDDEFDEIKSACETAAALCAEEKPFRRLRRRESRPPLVIAIVMQIFQQFTGINAIMFYAPVLFQTMGFESNASLLSAVVTGTGRQHRLHPRLNHPRQQDRPPQAAPGSLRPNAHCPGPGTN